MRASVLVSERALTSALVVVTASRLLLLVPLLWGISHSRVAAVASLLAVVALDVADGMLARAVGLDGTVRRLTDAGIDKLLVNTACIGLVLHTPSLLALYLPFAVRDVMLVLGSAWCIARRRTLIASRSSHKLGAAVLAVFGLLALCGVSGAGLVVAAAVACVLNWAPLPEYVRAFRAIRRRRANATLIVLSSTTASRPGVPPRPLGR